MRELRYDFLSPYAARRSTQALCRVPVYFVSLFSSCFSPSNSPPHGRSLSPCRTKARSSPGTFRVKRAAIACKIIRPTSRAFSNRANYLFSSGDSLSFDRFETKYQQERNRKQSHATIVSPPPPPPPPLYFILVRNEM